MEEIAKAHCKFVHGYSREFYFEFEASSLTKEHYVMDFGDLKDVKKWLEYQFDHTFLICADDPHLAEFQRLDEMDLIQLRILPNVSMEGTAKFVYEHVSKMVEKKTQGRVKIIKLEVRENEKNSALYLPE